jgi:hypothetical protein
MHFGRRDDEGRLALSRPASEKRQGKKSRVRGTRPGGQLRDLIFAPVMKLGARLAARRVVDTRKGAWKSAMGIEVVAKSINGRPTG